MRKGKSRSPPKLSNGRLPLILACLPYDLQEHG